MPRDVSNVLDRVEGCLHWGGEPNGDPQRAAEIDKAWADLKCDEIGCDHQKILEKYKNQPKILAEIKKFVTDFTADDESFLSCKQKTK